jgi:hypothetical protein
MFDGTLVSAVLDSMLGSARVYETDLEVAVKDCDDSKIAVIKQGPWELIGTVLERVKKDITLERIIAKNGVDQTMVGNIASDPIFRGVTYECGGMQFCLWKELSTYEKI